MPSRTIELQAVCRYHGRPSVYLQTQSYSRPFSICATCSIAKNSRQHSGKLYTLQATTIGSNKPERNLQPHVSKSEEKLHPCSHVCVQGFSPTKTLLKSVQRTSSCLIMPSFRESTVSCACKFVSIPRPMPSRITRSASPASEITSCDTCTCTLREKLCSCHGPDALFKSLHIIDMWVRLVDQYKPLGP